MNPKGPPLPVNEQAGGNARAVGLGLGDNPFTKAKDNPRVTAAAYEDLTKREQAWERGWVREDLIRTFEAQNLGT